MKVGHTLHKKTSLFTKLHLSLVKASFNVATKSFLLSYIYYFSCLAVIFEKISIN